jgi:hypothetical protein
VWVDVQVIDAAILKRRGAADQTVHFVAIGELQLREVRAVLAGDAGDECAPGQRPFLAWRSGRAEGVRLLDEPNAGCPTLSLIILDDGS